MAALYDDDSRYGAVNAPGLISLGLGLVAAWACQYGLVPAMQGPVATSLNNTDLSWLSGSVVAGGFYYVLSRRRVVRPVLTAVGPR